MHSPATPLHTPADPYTTPTAHTSTHTPTPMPPLHTCTYTPTRYTHCTHATPYAQHACTRSTPHRHTHAHTRACTCIRAMWLPCSLFPSSSPPGRRGEGAIGHLPGSWKTPSLPHHPLPPPRRPSTAPGARLLPLRGGPAAVGVGGRQSETRKPWRRGRGHFRSLFSPHTEVSPPRTWLLPRTRGLRPGRGLGPSGPQCHCNSVTAKLLPCLDPGWPLPPGWH